MENVNRPWSDETGLGKGNSTETEGFGLGRFHPLPPTFPAPIVLDPPDREPVEGHLVRGKVGPRFPALPPDASRGRGGRGGGGRLPARGPALHPGGRGPRSRLAPGRVARRVAPL